MPSFVPASALEADIHGVLLAIRALDRIPMPDATQPSDDYWDHYSRESFRLYHVLRPLRKAAKELKPLVHHGLYDLACSLEHGMRMEVLSD